MGCAGADGDEEDGGDAGVGGEALAELAVGRGASGRGVGEAGHAGGRGVGGVDGAEQAVGPVAVDAEQPGGSASRGAAGEVAAERGLDEAPAGVLGDDVASAEAPGSEEAAPVDVASRDVGEAVAAPDAADALDAPDALERGAAPDCAEARGPRDLVDEAAWPGRGRGRGPTCGGFWLGLSFLDVPEDAGRVEQVEGDGGSGGAPGPDAAPVPQTGLVEEGRAQELEDDEGAGRAGGEDGADGGAVPPRLAGLRVGPPDADGVAGSEGPCWCDHGDTYMPGMRRSPPPNFLSGGVTAWDPRDPEASRGIPRHQDLDALRPPELPGRAAMLGVNTAGRAPPTLATS